jgi:hypothetical protein
MVGYLDPHHDGPLFVHFWLLNGDPPTPTASSYYWAMKSVTAQYESANMMSISTLLVGGGFF